ncbi:MAG: sulfur oxidation c-type cytochrome SoxX [Gammaproteobacteria bacterium]|nr:MAG: sulfur oxidation c-type cytochrome SoxX [Gammaproteobacteria bacterium]
MRYTAKIIAGASTLAILLGGFLAPAQSFAVGEMPSKKVCKSTTDRVVKGGCIMTDRKKGNCMGCHQFKGLEKTRLQAGNIAPPLVAMKQRFPDKAKLRQQVWDATSINPKSSMPPFGKHSILSGKDIDLIVDFLYTL